MIIFPKTLGASESTYLVSKIKKRRDLQPWNRMDTYFFFRAPQTVGNLSVRSTARPVVD